MGTIYNTVETEEKAKEILTSKGAYSFENKTAQCECGETTAIHGYNEDFNFIGKVVVCEICGDDDCFVDEIFYTK